MDQTSEIATTTVSVEDLLSAERDENAVRKDFAPTEAVAIGRLIEEKHREKIEATRHEQRVAAGIKAALARGDAVGETTKRGNPARHVNEEVVVGQAALGSSEAAAAKAVGMSQSTLYRAKAVVAAAESEPEKFGDLPGLMDETGNVSGAHRENYQTAATRP